jgi:hypothetical protein
MALTCFGVSLAERTVLTCFGVSIIERIALTCFGLSTTERIALARFGVSTAERIGLTCIVSAFTELVKPLFNCPGLPEPQQIDVIKKIEKLDLPLNDMHILEEIRSFCSEIFAPGPGS